MIKHVSKFVFGSILFFTFLSVNAQENLEDIAIGFYRTIHSEIMNEDRLLYVHLPEGYDDSTESYPVVFQLYAHFLYAYFLPTVRSVERFGKHGKTPKMIVVGIKNFEFRYRDLLPEDHYGAKSKIDHFLRFIKDELIPFVDRNYRTKNYRILSGPQAGASFGIVAMAKHPDLFNALILSNPFWIESSRKTLINLFSNAIKHYNYSEKSLMISYDIEEDPDAITTLNEFSKLLKTAGNNSPKYFLHQLAPDFDLSVSVNFDKGLRHLFKDYEFPAKEKGQNLDKIKHYYKNLSQEMGLSIKISELTLVFEGDKFTHVKNYTDALEIYRFMLEGYPNSVMAFDRLGDVYNKTGKYDLAIKYYENFLKCSLEIQELK